MSVDFVSDTKYTKPPITRSGSSQSEYSPDNEHFAYSDATTVKLFNAHTSSVRCVELSNVLDIVFSSDGRFLVALASNEFRWIQWNVQTGRRMTETQIHMSFDPIFTIKYAWLCSSRAVILRAVDKNHIQSFTLKHFDQPLPFEVVHRGLAIKLNNNALASVRKNRTAMYYVETAFLQKRFRGAHIFSLHIQFYENVCVVALPNSNVMWCYSGQNEWSFRPDAEKICNFILTSDGTQLAVVTSNHLYLLHIPGLTVVEKWNIALPLNANIAISPDGRTLAFFAEDGTVDAWDLAEAERTHKRTQIIQEELMIRTWRPDHMVRWCMDNETMREINQMW